MLRTALAAAILCAGAAFLPAPARAASFDCGRARAADEIAVCRSPTLSALDSEMGGLFYAYARVPMMMGGSGARRDDAQAFLARRRVCRADTACLAAAYRARIAALKRGIDGAMGDYRRLWSGG